jgi:hypothetical protein
MDHEFVYEDPSSQTNYVNDQLARIPNIPRDLYQVQAPTGIPNHRRTLSALSNSSDYFKLNQTPVAPQGGLQGYRQLSVPPPPHHLQTQLETGATSSSFGDLNLGSNGYFGASEYPPLQPSLFSPPSVPTTVPGMAYNSVAGQLPSADLGQSNVYSTSSQSPEPGRLGASQARDVRPHRRGYQACQSCRDRKVKCDLGSELHKMLPLHAVHY